jgi:hypothetical protein
MNGEPSLFSCASSEIVEIHDFFMRWFSGRAGAAAEFERCEQAFDPEFGMVTPDGRSHGRAEIVERLRAARGSVGATFQIAIEAITPLWQSADAILVGYVEAQLRDGRPTRRRSSALFQRRASAPNGAVWRHLHETWM